MVHHGIISHRIMTLCSRHYVMGAPIHHDAIQKPAVGSSWLLHEHLPRFCAGTIPLSFWQCRFYRLMNVVVPSGRCAGCAFLSELGEFFDRGMPLIMLSPAAGSFPKAGWTGYPPLSEWIIARVRVDYGLGIQIGGRHHGHGINSLSPFLMRAPG